METAACPLLSTLQFTNNNNSKYASKFYKIPRTHLHFLSSFPLTFPRNTSFTTTRKKFNFNASSSSTSNATDQNPSQQLAVLLEVEGVLMDVYRLCNRQAFNVAFRKLGLDCANWTEPVYLDLLRRSAGDEERMLILYFNRVRSSFSSNLFGLVGPPQFPQVRRENS